MPAALFLALGLAVGSLGNAQVGDAEDTLGGAWAQVQEGELLGALERVGGLPEDAARFELEAEALYLGRRFRAAREAAHQGLDLDPNHARLALRALQASLWLSDASSARSDWAHLERAIAEGVEAEHRAAWEALLRLHGEEIQALEQREQTFAGARARVQTLVAVLGPLSLALLVLALVGSLAVNGAPRR